MSAPLRHQTTASTAGVPAPCSARAVPEAQPLWVGQSVVRCAARSANARDLRVILHRGHAADLFVLSLRTGHAKGLCVSSLRMGHVHLLSVF